MLYNNNYIEKLTGIKGVILKNIEEDNTSITLSIKLEVKDHICPCCGNTTRKIHDYRTQIIKEAQCLENIHILNSEKEDMSVSIAIKVL